MEIFRGAETGHSVLRWPIILHKAPNRIATTNFTLSIVTFTSYIQTPTNPTGSTTNNTYSNN